MGGDSSLPSLKKGKSIVTRIGLLVAVEIGLVIGSFVILAYFESQSALIGNSINIAGKNRFLTSVVVLQADKYFTGLLEISELDQAINQLDYNIDTLRAGGTIAGHELQPLPSVYLPLWEAVNERRQELKDSINEEIKTYPASPTDQNRIIAGIENAGGNLISASDDLVGELSNGSKERSESLVQMQISLLTINVGFHLFMLYMIFRAIRPVIAITKATHEIKNGNFNVAVPPGDGRDEISHLAYSFNEMAERLKKYDRMQKEFIGIASHQLKRPIQPILGYAQLSKEGYIAQQQALDGILQLAKELQQIANDMLDISRIESGILNYNMKTINIAELLRDIILSTRGNPLMDGKVAIDFVLENENSKGVCIEADRSRMGHALSNIVNNAIKFTPKGNITITLTEIQDLGKVRIEISDTGIGIDPEVLPKLFTKFTSKSETGTGLGLYISREIIAAHGGQLLAANNETGGATFTIYLPISRATAATNFS